MKFILKITLKIAGLLVTASVLAAALTVITERAGETYAREGAYSSELMKWEQERPEDGTLKILGIPVKLNFASLSAFRTTVQNGARALTAVLPEKVGQTVSSVWGAMTTTAEVILRRIF